MILRAKVKFSANKPLLSERQHSTFCGLSLRSILTHKSSALPPAERDVRAPIGNRRMYEIIELVVIVVVGVVAFTAIYKMLPLKRHSNPKPKFVFFPKYVASFDKPADEIFKKLQSLEFSPTKNGAYSRGKVYGDFSAKSIKLTVEVNEKESTVKVYSSFFGVLFDTGDIWQVTTDIVSGG